MASVLDLIGETPLVEVTRIDRGPCRLFLKLESANPSGSIKDRPARAMIEAAEADGRLKPGGTIVEATAGNTGLGLALVGGRKGYRTLLVVPDKMAREKMLHAKAMGAEVVITRSDVGKGHPDYYQDLAADDHAAHAGRDLRQSVRQSGQSAGARDRPPARKSCGRWTARSTRSWSASAPAARLTGIGRFMQRASPKTAMILADPEGSVLAPFIKTGRMIEAGSWAVEGIGEDFVPPNADLSLVERGLFDPRRGQLRRCARAAARGGRARRLVLRHAAGGGAALLPRAERAQARGEPGLRFRREISLQGVQRRFLAQEGWTHPHRARHRARRGHPSATARAPPSWCGRRTICARCSRACAPPTSRSLPVVDESGHVVGLVDESDVLAALLTEPDDANKAFERPVKDVMVTRLETISADAPIADLVPLFRKDYVAIVMDGDQFLGLATRLDLINHFRIAP